MADITPPVCLAAFTGAGIAGANPTKTGFTATKLGIAAFILPYMFVFSPQLLLQNTNLIEVIPMIAGAVLGMVAVAASTMNFFIMKNNIFESVLLFIGGILMIHPNIMTTLLGVAVVGGIYMIQKRRKKLNQTNVGLQV